MTSRGEHIRLEKGAIVKNHYEVVTPVGSGNFSKVYRVLDLQLPPKEQKRKPLAMKVIKKEYSSDAKYEKQMLLVLHQNDRDRSARVSRMYECFVCQECPVFIMPIHGPSVRSRRLGVNRGVVTHEKLMEFSLDLLETMDFVHFQCHMVHTDLKPENILISDSNVPESSLGDAWVVCDFGSASLWRMDKLDSDLISTRPYRAPEVVLGNKWHYAADMWSVGCILYEVACGHRLFEVRDDLTHLHMMERRIARLPEALTKNSKYSQKYFNARGDFLSTPDAIRFSKCRLTPVRDMFKDDKDFVRLLEGLFNYDPNRRLTATEALALPMFDRVRAAREHRRQLALEKAEAHHQRRQATSVLAGDESLMSTLASTQGENGFGFTDRSDRNAPPESAGDAKRRTASAASVAAGRPSIGVSTTSGVSSAATALISSKPNGQAKDTKSYAAASLNTGSDDVNNTNAADPSKDTKPVPSSATHATTHRPTATPAVGEFVAAVDALDVSPAGSSPPPESTNTDASASPLSPLSADLHGAGGEKKSRRVHDAGGRVGATWSKGIKLRSRAMSTPSGITKRQQQSASAASAVTSTNAEGSGAAGGLLGSKRGPAFSTPLHASGGEQQPRRVSTGSMPSADAAAGVTAVPKLFLHTPSPQAAAACTASPATAHQAKPATTTTTTTADGTTATGAAIPHNDTSVGEAKPSNPTNGTPAARDVSPPPALHAPPPQASLSAVDFASPDPVHHGATSSKDTPDRTSPSLGTPTGMMSRQPSAAPTPPMHRGSVESTVRHAAPTTIRPGPPAVTSTPATPQRPSLNGGVSSVGYQSPLERGATAVGLSDRTEVPGEIGSPETVAAAAASVPAPLLLRAGEVGELAEKVGSSEGHANPLSYSDSESARNHIYDEAWASGTYSEHGSTNGLLLSASNAEGSPRATDYRSPARRRASALSKLATPTGAVSSMPTAATTTPTAASVAVPQTMPNQSASSTGTPLVTTSEKALMHHQPPPQAHAQRHSYLSTNTPVTDGARATREASAAACTATAAIIIAGPPAAHATPSLKSRLLPQPWTASKYDDASELASTVPIARASLSQCNSRSGSLTSTAATGVRSPAVEALQRNAASNSNATSRDTSTPAFGSAAAAAGAASGAAATVTAPPTATSVVSRAPRSSVGTVRSAKSGPKLSTAAVGAATAATAADAPACGSTVAGDTNAVSSQKPNSATGAAGDVRRPSATPINASRRPAMKGESSTRDGKTTTTNSSDDHTANTQTTEEPTVFTSLVMPSAPHGAAAVAAHPPEAVTRSRERSLLSQSLTDHAREEKAAASRRASAESLSSIVAVTPDAALPKTPTSSAAAPAPVGPSILSPASSSLTGIPSHPRSSVVRPRSGSTHVVAPVHATITNMSNATLLESNPALSPAQLALHTPRGSCVLHDGAVTLTRHSLTLPAVVPLHAATGTDGSGPHRPQGVKENNGRGSQPVTPRERGLNATPAGEGVCVPPSPTAGQRPPRSSLGPSSTSAARSLSPTAAGGKSPRYNTKLSLLPNQIVKDRPSASAGALHAPVVSRSPHRPVAPGTTNTTATNSLMSSIDGGNNGHIAPSSLRSPRSAHRLAPSPKPAPNTHRSAAHPPSPRTGSNTREKRGKKADRTPSTDMAAASVGSGGAAATPTSPAASTVQQPLATMPRVTRSPQPRRTTTIVSSKPTSANSMAAAPLSRCSTAAVVAPTRSSVLRQQIVDTLLSANRMLPVASPNASVKSEDSRQPAGVHAPSAQTKAPKQMDAVHSSSRGSSVNNESSATSTGNVDPALAVAAPASATLSTSSSAGPKYRRDARTLKRITVPRQSSHSNTASMVSQLESAEESVSLNGSIPPSR